MTTNETLWKRALTFATRAHAGQTRKDGETPFIRHPIAVASGLKAAGVDCEVTLAAALLHDVLEDTPTTFEELSEAVGNEVAQLVAELTDDKSLPQAERKRLEVLHAKTASNRAKWIKLADKRENLLDILERPAPDWSAKRCREYFEFARTVAEAASGTHPGLERRFFEVYERLSE